MGGEDLHWLEEERLDQEQERRSCEQEAIGQWKEVLRPHQGLDRCCPEGQKGFGCEGLRRSQEGFSSLQEGQGALPVSKHVHYAEASAQGVGISTPFERHCLGSHGL